jgi:hypothetical protein
MTEEKKEVAYDNIGDAIKHMKHLGDKTNAQAKIWAENFNKFTGFKPNQPINAFDVVQLMYKFYGEPTNNDNISKPKE